MLNYCAGNGLTEQDKRLLLRTRIAFDTLFSGFDDPCVLIHGNLKLNSMLKDPRSDKLLAIVNPGMMTWAPREYELFRLFEPGMAEDLLWAYIRREPVVESFLWRRWLYVL